MVYQNLELQRPHFALILPSPLLQVLSHQNWNSWAMSIRFLEGLLLIMCPPVPQRLVCPLVQQRMSGVILENSCAEALY